MARNFKLKKSSSKKIFSRNAGTHKKNTYVNPMRGGHRM
ncbi:MAG: hypothetical protein [Microvirus sp.]|nr:MAG: hypothetical protein [Microvirus sp.]